MLPDNITGRDGYIITNALIVAIEVIRSLPEHRQEGSDADDMEKLLHVYAPDPNWRSQMEMSVRSMLRLPDRKRRLS